MFVQVAIVSNFYGGTRARLAYNVIRAYSGVCGLHVGCYGCVFVGDFVSGWSGPRIDVDVVPGSDRGIKFRRKRECQPQEEEEEPPFATAY